MKRLIVTAAAVFFAVSVYANPTCEQQSADKKLHGAAKTSFIKKCEREASKNANTEACELQASNKKLSGAAKNSFVKKCVRDASNNTIVTACEQQAADKKLHGAANTSFMKKCVRDAGGVYKPQPVKPAEEKK